MKGAAAALAALAAILLIAAAGPERGFRGVYAVRGDAVVASADADRLFTPASVMKLVVAAIALHHLGPDYRIATVVRAAGDVAGGTLAGDLAVVAAGDPTWSERFHPGEPRRPVTELARRVAAAGVRRVTGDLVVDASRFPGRPHPTDRGVGEAAYAWAAPTAALAVDEAAVDVEMSAGRRGEPARLAGPADLEVVNHTTTVGPERHGRGTVDFLPVWGQATVVARGEFPASEPPYRIELAAPDAEARAGRALAAALAAAGVDVAGTVRVTRTPAVAGRELARVLSPPLAEILPPLLERSHNWLAETLLRVVPAETGGEGRDEAGLAMVAALLTGEVGVAPESFHLVDASGLSPANLLAPRAVVELLRWAWRQPWRDVWVAALATAEEGTLASWPELPPLVAKTGTLTHADALAGYLLSPSGEPPSAEPIAFAVLFNHRPGARAAVRAEIAALLRAWARR